MWIYSDANKFATSHSNYNLPLPVQLQMKVSFSEQMQKAANSSLAQNHFLSARTEQAAMPNMVWKDKKAFSITKHAFLKKVSII